MVPISSVLKLQMEKTQKIGICFIFLLGSLYALHPASLLTNLTSSQRLLCLPLPHNNHNPPCPNNRHKLGQKRRLHLVLGRALHRHNIRLPPHAPTPSPQAPRNLYNALPAPPSSSCSCAKILAVHRLALTIALTQSARNNIQKALACTAQESRLGRFAR